MEDMVIDRSFWAGKRVLLTGHTGFKGSWLSLWLQALGAKTVGYALHPTASPNLFEVANVANAVTSVEADVRDLDRLSREIAKHRPEIIFHLAAQSLVRRSYADPVETYGTNVMGTVNLLEAVRKTKGIRAVVNVTSDKCYENLEWIWGYRESDRLGGFDPYSNSKACAELVTAAYRNSFFGGVPSAEPAPAVASARAGNVIGGGDWAADRLIPDIILALTENRPAQIRNPSAIRPWQHVLEPLWGYLLLAQQLCCDGPQYAGAWNFGPSDADTKTVEWVTEFVTRRWRGGGRWTQDKSSHPHETRSLRLDCSKAYAYLGWQPRLSVATALEMTVDWYQAKQDGNDMSTFTRTQIDSYQSLQKPLNDTGN